MSQLKIIIKNEILTDIKSKSFWITTFVLPILLCGFGGVMGYLLAESNSPIESAYNINDGEDISERQGFAMCMGIFLAMFLMGYGSLIFNKVKKEKCNRIVEVLATCVSGRTMMLGKILSVAIVGFTQIILWCLLIAAIVIPVTFIFNIEIPEDIIGTADLLTTSMWSILFFIGGYLFYGTLYALCGAITDKDGENQSYMTIITFLLLGSFYIGQYAVTNPDSALVLFCSFFPFTAPTIACVNAIAGEVPLWQSILALITLYAFAIASVSLTGKLYTSSIMLKGKKLSPQDLIAIFKMK